jgi:hypothetical protein
VEEDKEENLKEKGGSTKHTKKIEVKGIVQRILTGVESRFKRSTLSLMNCTVIEYSI